MMRLLQNIFSYTVIPIFMGLILGSGVTLLWLDGAPTARLIEGATQFYFILSLPTALAVIWIDWRGRQQSSPVVMPFATVIGWAIWFAVVMSLMYMVGITAFASSGLVPAEPDLFIDLRASLISWRLLVNSAISIVLTVVLRLWLLGRHSPSAQ